MGVRGKIIILEILLVLVIVKVTERMDSVGRLKKVWWKKESRGLRRCHFSTKIKH
jgi:hypothetical protein